MSRRRFFVPSHLIQDRTAILPDDQAHHLRDVLRVRSGDPVEIFDGESAGYTGRVVFRGGKVCVEGLTRLSTQEDLQSCLVLAQALIKADRFEWILQKAAELGVSEIIPLVSKNCDIRIPAGRIDNRLDRWRRIVREASRQSCRVTVPIVHRPTTFTHLLSIYDHAGCRGLFLCPGASDRWKGIVREAPGYMLFIGPEGGWHPSETEAAKKSGFDRFSLGPRILRAETAAIAALALVQYQIENRQLQIDNAAKPDIG